MIWLDPLSPAVRSAVVSGAWGKAPHSEHGHVPPVAPAIDTVADAIASASDILTRLTAAMIHPAVQVEEDFIASPRAARLHTSFQPVRSVVSVSRMTDSGALQDVTDGTIFGGELQFPSRGWTSFGGCIHFSPDCSWTLDRWFMSWCGYHPRQRECLRVLYNAGSTITASARRALITLAHDIWLENADCDECGLPARTTVLTRQGLTMAIGDTQQVSPLSSGSTGLPEVDAWIVGVNPRKATRMPGVYDPSSPPPTVRAVRVARPVFGAGVNLSSGADINIGMGSAPQ